MSNGTYAGLQFCDDSIEALGTFINNVNVPNAVSKQDLHVTLLYSKKHLPNLVARGLLSSPIKIKPESFEVWESSGNNCLVLKLHSFELLHLHKTLMHDHQATYDYAEYHPHVTLSYNVGDFNTSSLNIKLLPEELLLCKEYKEELNLNWVDNQ